MHPGYKLAVVTAGVLLVAGFIFSMLTRSDNGQTVPLVHPAVSSLMTLVGSLAIGFVGSGFFADRNLQNRLGEAQRRCDELIDERVKNLRHTVCGQASTINVAVGALEKSAQEIVASSTDAVAVGLTLRQMVFEVRAVVATSVGAVFNAFGIAYQDGLTAVHQAAAAGLDSLTPPAVVPAQGPLPTPLVEAAPLPSAPAGITKVSISCPRCRYLIQGVRARLLEPTVKCFCPDCAASIELDMPSRTPRVVGTLNRVDDAEIVSQIGKRAVLLCPVCQQSYATLTKTQKRLFALCVDDQTLLVVPRLKFHEWRQRGVGR